MGEIIDALLRIRKLKEGAKKVTHHLFPFKTIPKNSKIILYAAGDVGKHYYSQIKTINYCEILLWVDKNNADGQIVKEVETIVELNTIEYDYVVIAVQEKKTAIEIKTTLVEKYGVAEEKIIHENLSYKTGGNSSVSTLTVDDLLYEQEVVEKEVVNYFYESMGDIDYFSPLINEIKELLTCTDVDKSKIFEAIENKSLILFNSKAKMTIESKIVLIYVLLEAKCFSKEIMREFVRLTSEVKDNLSLKYWLLNDLSLIWFLFPEIVYDDFFFELKQIREDYARKLCLNWTPPPYVKEGNADICVIVVNLESGRNFSSTPQYVSPTLRAMSDKKYNIHIIDLSPYRNDSGAGIVNPFFRLDRQSETRRERMPSCYPINANFYHIANAMMKDRQQDILDLISKINPLCILDFSDEFSSISYYYHQSYPTIYIPLRERGRTASTFFHRYVIHGDNIVELYPPLREAQVLRLPLFLEHMNKSSKIFNRKKYGLTDEDVVVITVGERLQSEMSNELAEQMCELMCSDNKVKWLIVGCNEFPYINRNYKDLISRNVIFIGYENDLPGLYGICDIYLNPPRTGGGSSVAWAAQQGLAIASPLKAGDGGRLIFDKKNLISSEKALVPHIERLSKDKTLLNQEKEKYKKITMEWCSDVNYFIEKFLLGMDELIKDFEKGKE